ncbi:MAG TPA: MBL fold metallo-hydrolase, partial [Gemmatimonadales bacterium]|nr:MBL fold metallo-hydrolase [Gemmatimonadales bacterium]
DARNPMLAYLDQAPEPPRVIDALILTHPHDDHYPGAEGVVRHFDVCDYYDPGYPDTTKRYEAFLHLVREARCHGEPVRMHMGRETFGTLDWGSELDVKVLYAWPGSPTGLGHGNTLVNNASIVLKITWGTQSILLMGDAEGKDRNGLADMPRYAEQRLMAEYGAAGLKATVLKVAHHGSETSSTNPFIAAVDPKYVIVSSGRKSFGGTFLPDRTALERYCAHNPAIRIFSTDQNDAAEHRTTRDDADGDNIMIRMNADTTIVTAAASGRPYIPTTCTP